jgi:hypothetical protein
MASIGRVPKVRLILVAGALAGASFGILGCGGGGPKPSIPPDNAATLLGRIQEIHANVDNGSCFVASDRTDALLSDIQSLPSSVNGDVKQALENGANQLKILLEDPSQCQGSTTTTTPTTTPSTQSTESTPTHTQSTTSTPTQITTPTQTQAPPTVTSGGIGPGGTGQ